MVFEKIVKRFRLCRRCARPRGKLRFDAVDCQLLRRHSKATGLIGKCNLKLRRKGNCHFFAPKAPIPIYSRGVEWTITLFTRIMRQNKGKTRMGAAAGGWRQLRGGACARSKFRPRRK